MSHGICTLRKRHLKFVFSIESSFRMPRHMSNKFTRRQRMGFHPSQKSVSWTRGLPPLVSVKRDYR